MNQGPVTKTRDFHVPNVRAKLHSLKNLRAQDDDSLLVLQKSLQKYNNTIDDPEITVEEQQFSKKDQQDTTIQDKLWKYFQSKSTQYQNKIEKQKINAWLKLIRTILQQTDKKIKINEKNIQQMQSIIKNKYKQTHQLFKQIQTIKLERSTQHKQVKSRRKRSTVQSSRGQKINIIKQNISDIKQQIQDKNLQNQKIKLEVKKLKQQRDSFISNLLKNGFYLSNGIIFFFQKMVEFGIHPDHQNLPDFLDSKSKQFLIKQYQLIKQTITNKQRQQTHRSTSKKTRSKSSNQLATLARQEHFKDIYNGTKNYLLQLLLQQSWKKQQSKLPKINNINSDDAVERRRQIQRKRIRVAYPQELRDKVRKIQFGVKTDTIL